MGTYALKRSQILRHPREQNRGDNRILNQCPQTKVEVKTHNLGNIPINRFLL